MAAKEKTVICVDLDGTILDSMEAHAKAFNLAFKKNNLPTVMEKDIISCFGPPAEEIVKKLFPKISKRKLPQTVSDKNNFLIKQTAKYAKQIPDADKALEELKKQYKLALISNCVHSEITALLKATGINPKIFDAILGKGEMDHKPSPEVIKNVERVAGAKVEYVVGDTIYDIRTGKSANVKTVAVLSGVHDIKKLGGENPTLIVKSIAILPDILFGRL